MRPRWPLVLLIVMLMLPAGCVPARPPVPTRVATSLPTPTAPFTPVATQEEAPPTAPRATQGQATPSTPAVTGPYGLISLERMLATMQDLSAIQPYSGWRNSASQGEREALDYLAARLAELEHLGSLGLGIERQEFSVFLATELWETRLQLTVAGRPFEVPASGLRGPIDTIGQALRFDSDGVLNDSARNPRVVEGPAVLLRSAAEVRALGPTDRQGQVVFLDFAAIDRVLLGIPAATQVVFELLSRSPAGLVLVTHFSNRAGESHGSLIGDLSALNFVEGVPLPPTLYVRLEDLAPAGIDGWDALAQVQAARLTWDADVFSPGTSGNLVARIPGSDPSRAVILGAHVDSPNSPGAMDDGSGSAVLLEIARVLDVARIQPPVDLYLAWFGSEETGLYGSSYFATTHAELLDRALAMLQLDCLTRPLEGIDPYLNLVAWSYGRLGNGQLTWPNYLGQAAGRQGVETYPVNYYGVESDNSAFAGFDVPNANLIPMDNPAMESLGGVHYAGHLHDPYDTVELAGEAGDMLEQMAQVALAAALETGRDNPALRVAPRPDRRVLFVASHTEAGQMTPSGFIDLGMALSWEGFDVDVVPYGQAVTPADLENTAMVVVLPVVDYPSAEGDLNVYDEAWEPEEVAALEAYVARGGLLVLTNSAHRLKLGNRVLEANEDWSDANVLAARFGVTYQEGTIAGGEAQTEGTSPLVQQVAALAMAAGNGVPSAITTGEVLARVDGAVAAALVDYGSKGGQVLVLADVGILGTAFDQPANLPFWQNLARYARSR